MGLITKRVVIKGNQAFGRTEYGKGALRTARLGGDAARDAPGAVDAVDAGTSFLAVAIDNSSTPPEEGIDPNGCDWSGQMACRSARTSSVVPFRSLDEGRAGGEEAEAGADVRRVD